MNKLCIIDVVGLTPELALRTKHILNAGRPAPLRSPLPAVTCTSQATLLTGLPPSDHGIVGNGWLYRDTQEVRFWQQANSLMQGEPLYRGIRTAKIFWWFNLGSGVDYSLTPRPHYGSDGSKEFAVLDKTGCGVEERLGAFPFPAFWGPTAGLPSSRWIADAAALVMREKKPELSLVYLPHLDYDYQRNTPGGQAALDEVDDCVGRVMTAAGDIGAQVVIVSEYGLVPVNRAVHINRLLREKGWLEVRGGPYGEMLQPQDSRAFAVADHQLAHVYIRGLDHAEVKARLLELPGIASVHHPAELGLGHPRSGELVALSAPDAWFAYPYWLDDRLKPDFATSVDIHRKPGYDPCELFMSSKLNAARALLKKKLGLRYRFDVTPLDTALVKGSHGLRPAPQMGPVILGPGAVPADMLDFKEYVLGLL